MQKGSIMNNLKLTSLVAAGLLVAASAVPSMAAMKHHRKHRRHRKHPVMMMHHAMPMSHTMMGKTGSGHAMMDSHKGGAMMGKTGGMDKMKMHK